MQNVMDDQSASMDNSLDNRPASQHLAAFATRRSVIHFAPPRNSNVRTDNEQDVENVRYESMNVEPSTSDLVHQSQMQPPAFPVATESYYLSQPEPIEESSDNAVREQSTVLFTDEVVPCQRSSGNVIWYAHRQDSNEETEDVHAPCDSMHVEPASYHFCCEPELHPSRYLTEYHLPQQQSLEEPAENFTGEQPLEIVESEQPPDQHYDDVTAFESQHSVVHRDCLEESNYPADEEAEEIYAPRDSMHVDPTSYHSCCERELHPSRYQTTAEYHLPQQQSLEEPSEDFTDEPRLQIVESEEPPQQHLDDVAAFEAQDSVVHRDYLEDSTYPADEEAEEIHESRDSMNVEPTADLIRSQLPSPAHSETTESDDAPLEKSAEGEASERPVYVVDEDRLLRHFATIAAIVPASQQPLKFDPSRKVPIGVVAPMPRGARSAMDQRTLVEIAAGPTYPVVWRALFGDAGGEAQRGEPPREQEDSDDESDEEDEEESPTFASLAFDAVLRRWEAIKRAIVCSNEYLQTGGTAFVQEEFEFLFLATKYVRWSIFDEQRGEMHPPPPLDWGREPAEVTLLRMLMFPIVFPSGESDNEKIQRKIDIRACVKEIKKIYEVEEVRRERDSRHGTGW